MARGVVIMEIIGIHGKRRHGKDTIGAFLTEYKFKIGRAHV